MVGAILFLKIVRMVDLAAGWEASVSSEGARALLGTLSASMFTFIVFVFSILLLSVQLASAQLTPRAIALFFCSPVLKSSLTFFVFPFTFSLAVLFRIGDTVMQISLWIAGYSCLASIGIFLYMIDNVGKSLRPISLLNLLGGKGQEVIMDVFPEPFTGKEGKTAYISETENRTSLRIIETRQTGVLLAFDVAGLVALARRTNCLIELVPQVGDFVTAGDPLFRLYEGGESIPDHQLQYAVAIGQERTMEQDPGFAFRMIVDIASKALSPAINDPTTAVLALDQINRLLRMVAMRQLATGQAYDATGQLRLIFRTPDWDDFLSLAITEIRQYGKESLQVVRRIKAMLENLIAVVPQQRAESIRLELDVLSRSNDREFYLPEDRLRANSADSLGMGGSD